MPRRCRNYILFFLLIFLLPSSKIFAATIGFSDLNKNYKVGDIIKITVSVSSSQSINAVAANLNFSEDILSLISISKEESKIDFWPVEPKFLKSKNEISFEGVVFGGTKTEKNKLLTFIFKAKEVGLTSIYFSDVSILANDGSGLDIYSDSNPPVLLININKASIVDSKKPVKKQLGKINKKTEQEMTQNVLNFNDQLKLFDLYILWLLFIIIILILEKIKKYMEDEINKKESNLKASNKEKEL